MPPITIGTIITFMFHEQQQQLHGLFKNQNNILK